MDIGDIQSTRSGLKGKRCRRLFATGYAALTYACPGIDPLTRCINCLGYLFIGQYTTRQITTPTDDMCILHMMFTIFQSCRARGLKARYIFSHQRVSAKSVTTFGRIVRTNWATYLLVNKPYRPSSVAATIPKRIIQQVLIEN